MTGMIRFLFWNKFKNATTFSIKYDKFDFYLINSQLHIWAIYWCDECVW